MEDKYSKHIHDSLSAFAAILTHHTQENKASENDSDWYSIEPSQGVHQEGTVVEIKEYILW